jgi:hypothetical protein
VVSRGRAAGSAVPRVRDGAGRNGGSSPDADCRRWYSCGQLRCGWNEAAVKLTLMPVFLAVVCVIAGCASTAETALPAHLTPGPPLLTPAPTASPLTGQFGAVLTLPVVKSSPVGKGVAWSAGSYKKTDSSVTVDWHDTPSAECGRAYEVRLDETSSSVTIQLVPGKRTVPVCSSDERSFTMSVPLSAPIGSRSILQQ